MNNYDVIVIGGGPAGLAAAISAKKSGASVLLIERESRLGGILKQCIHDGFGLIRFEEKLSGPEYAERYIDMFNEAKIEALTQSFVTSVEKKDGGFIVSLVNRKGISDYFSKTLILATGCRERTAKQVSIHGTRPSGVFTAGTAQSYTNLMGLMPAKKCLILGSGDIGLIMARRLTLEGAKVLGVYEAKPSPSGLTRNIYQCLNDYDIPLYLSHTVTKTFGHDRLEAVEVCELDEKMQPIEGTERIIECDTLILSVGLIPENELAENLGVEIDPRTKGPVCDESFMTSEPGIFSCGNALHVNDLVDYVSESGELAGIAAAQYSGAASRRLLRLEIGENIAYLVPQMIDFNKENKKTVLYFRSSGVFDNSRLKISADGNTVLEKKYAYLRPPEMERLEIDFSRLGLTLSENSKISFEIEVAKS